MGSMRMKRYFGYHVDITPEAAASVLGGSLIYAEREKGQWVGVIRMDKIEEATGRDGTRQVQGVRSSSAFSVFPQPRPAKAKAGKS